MATRSEDYEQRALEAARARVQGIVDRIQWRGALRDVGAKLEVVKGYDEHVRVHGVLVRFSFRASDAEHAIANDYKREVKVDHLFSSLFFERTSEAVIVEAIRGIVLKAWVHELDEGFRLDGKPLHEPHPPRS